MSSSSARAMARVGLLGNPSDGYGGRVLAMTVPQFSAEVHVTASASWEYADTELLQATVEALRTRRPELVVQPVTFAFSTTIPRQVGLAGSSAIIIAALRALAAHTETIWDLVALARTALEVETDVLGWAAGPQDRVVQAYEGLVDMDFATPWQADAYEPLDPGQLPPLFVAWDPGIGESSDVAHTNVRERWLAGEPLVMATMQRFAELATEGRNAFDDGTAAACWPDLMHEAFDLRSQIWNIKPSDRAMVDAGQAHGAGVAFAGSGGAVVGCVQNVDMLDALAAAYHDLGAGFARLQ